MIQGSTSSQRRKLAVRAIAVLTAFTFAPPIDAQGLVTTYDQRGLATLSYNGVYLINLNAGLGDPFQVWSYELGGASGFGGSFLGWDSSSNTLTWSGNWGGRVTCQFSSLVGTNNLLVTITITNGSGQTLNGVNIYPLGLQFPQLPSGFGAPNYPQFHNNIDAPAMIAADYGSGMTVLADGDAKPLYLGFSPSGPANHYNLVVGSLASSSFSFLGSAVPVSRPIPAGGSDTYKFSLRFAPSGTDYHKIAGDVLTTFGQTWPQTFQWADRRPIGELFMTNPTSSWTPDNSRNPRNYTVAQNVNVQTTGGLTAFQQAVLAYADNSVQVLKSVGAQGAIVWDLEGQQFPQDGGGGSNYCGGVPGELSYVGSPDVLAQVSPEMNSIADAFFKKFTAAGLKCGMTLRPQTVVLAGSQSYQNWCTSQNPSTAASVLIQKAQYAYNRWGCTIFYVDSDGGPLNSLTPDAWAAINQALPNLLFIPENSWFKDWAYTAPLASYDLSDKPLHTVADARTIWPTTATVTYIGDVPNHDLTNNPNDANQWNEYVQAVRAGDILAFRGWFDDEPLNSQVVQIYEQAGVGSPPALPTINSFMAAPGSISSGGSATLSWNVSGASSLSINNGVGTVTGNSISVSPAATTTYTLTASNAGGSANASTTVTVTAATTPPSVLMSAPAANSAISGAVTVAATATAGSYPIAGVQFKLDSANLGTEVTASPYQLSWNTTQTGNGTHMLSAVVFDTHKQSANSAAITVTVNNTAVPAVSSFTASPSSISSGGSSTLSWNVSGATSLSIDNGVGTVTGNGISVSPPATSTYTLTASNSSGSAKATTTVTVTATTPSSQTVYVMDMNNNRVEEFNSGGSYVNEVVSAGSNGGGFNSPTALAVDGSGNIWVADMGNQRVVKFNSGGSYVLQLGGNRGNGAGQFNNPWGVAVDLSGNVWVTDTGNNRVQEFNTGGNFLKQFPCSSGACNTGGSPGEFASNSAIGIALDQSGNVWVVDSGNCRVEEFNTSGTYLSEFAIGCNDTMLAIDGSSNFWIVDPSGQRVMEYNTSGDALLQVGCSSGFCGYGGVFNNPSDVAIDSNGNVWVTDTGHARVVEFSGSGALLSQFPCSSGVCNIGSNTDEFGNNSAWGIAIR